MTELGHLLVADAVFAELSWPRELQPTFYVGAIAPDAHRTTLGVDYRDLHFRSSHRSGRRLIDFLRQYLRPALMGTDAYAQAFYTGWLSHICADHVWREHLRHELSSVWQRVLEGAELESNALREEFYEECDWLDQVIFAERTQQIDDIRWMLQHATVVYTVGPLRLEDVNRWCQHVLLELLPPPAPNLERPQLLDREFTNRCLRDAIHETQGVLAVEVNRVTGEAPADQGTEAAAQPTSADGPPGAASPAAASEPPS